jgi:hypothetical protein
LTFYKVTTFAIVGFLPAEILYHFFALYSGAASLGKQASYLGILSDSLVSDLNLVKNLHRMFRISRTKEFILTETSCETTQLKSETMLLIKY